MKGRRLEGGGTFKVCPACLADEMTLLLHMFVFLQMKTYGVLCCAFSLCMKFPK
jgi:hypothetical protein